MPHIKRRGETHREGYQTQHHREATKVKKGVEFFPHFYPPDKFCTVCADSVENRSEREQSNKSEEEAEER